MAVDLMQAMMEFLAGYGLVAVFILLVLDAAMLMPVLPGEVVMIMAVATYANDLADLAMLVVLATLAALVGSVALYAVCRGGGRRLVESHPHLFMMDRRRREKLERTFQRPVGQSLVLILRIVPLTRVLVNIPAGLARMKMGRFIVLSTVGLLVFHAGFMWLAYEYQRPDSAVALRAESLQDAYANPAWEYVQTNQVIAGLIALGLGAILSLRSSAAMMRDPEGASRSLFGVLAVRILFWAPVAIGVALYVAPDALYAAALAGGLDVPDLAARVGLEPMPLAASTATIAWCIGVILLTFEKTAKRRQRRAERDAKRRKDALEQVRERVAARAGVAYPGGDEEAGPHRQPR